MNVTNNIPSWMDVNHPGQLTDLKETFEPLQGNVG